MNILTLLQLVGCIILFSFSWVKLCITDKSDGVYVLGQVCNLCAACILGGHIVVPTVINDSWQLAGQISLITGLVIWIASKGQGNGKKT